MVDHSCLLIIGEEPERDIKVHSDLLGHCKEANWLYNGLLLTGDFSPQQLAEAVTADPKNLPTAIIDNGRLITAKSLGKNWLSSVRQCLEMSPSGQTINAYTIQNDLMH